MKISAVAKVENRPTQKYAIWGFISKEIASRSGIWCQIRFSGTFFKKSDFYYISPLYVKKNFFSASNE